MRKIFMTISVIVTIFIVSTTGYARKEAELDYINNVVYEKDYKTYYKNDDGTVTVCREKMLAVVGIMEV